MKKRMAVFLAFLLLLSACSAENPVSTETILGVPTTETQSVTLSTTNSTSSSSSSSFTGESEDESEEYVPFKVYVNNDYYYIYLDRAKLVRAIEEGNLSSYPVMSHQLEDMMTLPYYYAYASEYDANGLAIVSFRGGDYHGQVALIDKKGLSVSDLSSLYATMYRVKDKYVATKVNESRLSLIGFDLLDADGTYLMSFDDMPMPKDGLLYFHGGEVFDVSKTEYLQGLPTEQGKFSRSNDLGDGYFGVADFSDAEADINPVVFQDGVGHYRMALYKDGNLLTDFLYFSIVPLGEDLFYLYDGNEYFFYNAATGKRVLNHTEGVVIGDYEFTRHGSLIRASWVHGVVFITDKAVVEQAYPIDHGYTMFAYKRKNIRGVIAVIPYLISGTMEDANVISILNTNIEDDVQDVIPPNMNDVVGMFHLNTVSSVATLSVESDVIYVQNLMLETDNTTGRVRDVYHEFFYDLNTGENMFYEDWFESPDEIKALLLERAEQVYFANGAPNGPVEDPESFFGVQTFARRIAFGPKGMILHLWSGFPPAEISKDELKELMKAEYYEKLVVPMVENGSRLHK